MKRSHSPRSSEEELIDTVNTANSIIEFYEEILAFHNEKTRTLEAQNKVLLAQVSASKELVKTLLRTPRFGVLN